MSEEHREGKETMPEIPVSDRLICSEDAEMVWNRKDTQRIVDVDWMQVIEDSLPYLDAVLREPMRTVEQVEQIKPIAVSRHINNRSLRHLAQHAEYWRDGTQGEPRPDKILNVRREDSMQLYENRFLNTLIHRLREFVERRYAEMCAGPARQTDVSMTLEVPFSRETRHGRIRLSMEMTEKGETDEGETQTVLLARVERLRRIAEAYCHSDLAVKMGDQMVRPPILATNAITKNKNLYQCLMLFRFLEEYDRVGYRIAVEEYAEQPSESYLRRLHEQLYQQVDSFLRQIDGEAEVSAHSPFATTFRPRLIHRFEEESTERFDVIDTVYRRVFPVVEGKDSDRPFSEDEERILHAIEAALEAEEILRRCREEAASDRETSIEAGRGERVAVNLDTLCAVFPDGAEITPSILRLAQMIPQRARFVKILARGQIDKAFRITAHAFSGEAKRYVEQAGGTAIRCEGREGE